jgi:1-acyl-sn-glycerol-3-phosphate acyltransferase
MWLHPTGYTPQRIHAFLRAVAVLLWCLVTIPVQAALLLLPGRAKIWFAQLFWAGFCRIFGVSVRVIGKSCHGQGRPVVYVSNHSSWLDVGVLGARLQGCFVSKEDVASWPLVNIIARLGRTVYVRRTRASTAGESRTMRERLQNGDNLILFPEGTTSDGSRVLPFRSSLLSVAEGEPAPLVQPISVVYDRLAGLPAMRANRPIFAYYGDMSIGPHFWRLAQCRGMRATVLLHAPVDPRDYPDRKALTRAVWATVAAGAATLRQNRPAQPLRPEMVPELNNSSLGEMEAYA